MLNNSMMNAKDAVSASLAECFVTIEGKRYNFMQAINLEAKIEKTSPKSRFWVRQGKGIKQPDGKGPGLQHFIIIPVSSVSFCTAIKKLERIFISISR